MLGSDPELPLVPLSAPASPALYNHGPGTSGGGSTTTSAETLRKGRWSFELHSLWTEFEDVSIAVRRGEILGIAGLVGAGRTEFARAVFGADPKASGRIEILGQPVTIRSPADAIAHGIGLVPEDRKQQALFLSLAIRSNLSIASLDAIAGPLGLISDGTERALVETYRDGQYVDTRIEY